MGNSNAHTRRSTVAHMRLAREVKQPPADYVAEIAEIRSLIDQANANNLWRGIAMGFAITCAFGCMALAVALRMGWIP